MPKPVRTRTLDDTTRATDPGQINLSRAKLKLLRPDLFGFRAALRRLRSSSKFPQLTYIREQLQCGDSRAAVVVSTSPLLIAAYTDELDCVAVLLFPDEFRATYGLARGSRLLTVNTYKRGKAYDADLILGPNWIERWVGFHPIIAEFVSDDLSRIEARKAQIAVEEWSRAASLGAAYLRAKPGFARDGRPVYASLPAAKRYN
jgi:hypothetical protein